MKTDTPIAKTATTNFQLNALIKPMKYRKTISVTKHYDIQASSKKALEAAIATAKSWGDGTYHAGGSSGVFDITLAMSPPAPPVPRWKRLKNDDIIHSTDLMFWKDSPSEIAFVVGTLVGLKAGSFNLRGFYRLVTDNQD